MQKLLLICVIQAGVCVPWAAAEFVLIDNFESYTPGTPIHGQGNWQAEATTNAVAAGVSVDPLNSANRVLSIGAGGFTAGQLGHRETINTDPALVISQGTTATVFMRVAWNAQDVDLSVGMSYVPNPISNTIFNSFTQFESQTAFSFAPGYDDVAVRDGGTSKPLTTEVSPLTWYNLWLAIDNAADTTQVYIQGGAFTDQTLLDSTGQTEFAFRNGLAEEDLVTFFIATGRNATAQPPNATENLGPVYIDDLYVDTTGLNLANPVPEPSTLLLGLIGIALFTGLTTARRRRVH